MGSQGEEVGGGDHEFSEHPSRDWPPETVKGEARRKFMKRDPSLGELESNWFLSAL